MQRYALEENALMGGTDMFECEDGDYVLFSEVEHEIISLKDALLTIASGYEQRNIAPRMNGTHQSGPHLIDRKRMMEIAKDVLEVANAK